MASAIIVTGLVFANMDFTDPRVKIRVTLRWDWDGICLSISLHAHTYLSIYIYIYANDVILSLFDTMKCMDMYSHI